MDRNLAALLVRMLGLVLLVIALMELPHVFSVFMESNTQQGFHTTWIWTKEIEGIRAPMALLLTVTEFLLEVVLGTYFLARYRRVALWLACEGEVRNA